MASRNPLRPVQNKPADWKKRQSEAPGAKRRQTTTNARASLAPRASLALPQQSSSRVSLAMAPSGLPSSRASLSLKRQSSIGGRHGPSKGVDRKIIELHIRKIIEFLSLRNYPNCVSFKMLSQPSSKDFIDITLFLIREVDPTYEFKGHADDEIPKFFRTIRCPHTIKRSLLRAVGTIASWPPVLQALAWLVDLLNYQAAEQAMRLQSEDDLHQKLFFDFLSLAYQQFLQEGKETYEELEADLSQIFAQRNSKVQHSIDDIERENQALLAEIEKLEAEKRQVPVVKQKLGELQQECHKYQGMVREWQSHKDQIQERNDMLATKLNEVNEQLESVQQEQAQVLAKLEHQEMKSDDVQRLFSDRTQLQQELQLAMKHHKSLQTQSTDLEQELSAQFEEVLPTLKQYSTIATAMKLIPATAKYAQGFSFEVSLRPRDLHDEAFTVEIKKDIKLNIMKLRETFKHKLMEHDERRIQLQHQFEQESERFQDKSEEAVHAKRQLEETLRRAESSKQQLMEDYQELQSQVSDLRERCQRLEKTSQEELADAVQHHQSLAAHLAQEQEEMQKAKDAQIARYHETCTVIMTHKEFLKEHLEQRYHSIKRDLYCLA